jgi:hypothetical protein
MTGLPSSGTQQRLDRAAFVHGAVALGHLFEGQRQVEDSAGIDLPVSLMNKRCC